jgi:hypothetical protein
MPRYFFHIKDGVVMPDKEGTELRDVAAAHQQAVVFAGEVLRDCGETFWKNADWRVWVTDEAGETVCALRFAAEPSEPA